jgi:uncharacterized phiE125 gp8 family phage protein
MIDTGLYQNLLRLYPREDPNYLLTVVTAAASEPVTYDDLAAEMRIDETDDQSQVTTYGIGARVYLEKSKRLTAISTTYDVSFDEFDPYGIKLPTRPVTSVTSVKYIDTLGVLQTLDPSQWVVDAKSVWTRVKSAPGKYWPQTLIGQPNAVTIRFVAGYADASHCDDLVKLAIRKLAYHWYENRETIALGKAVEKMPYALEAVMWLLAVPEV